MRITAISIASVVLSAPYSDMNLDNLSVSSGEQQDLLLISRRYNLQIFSRIFFSAVVVGFIIVLSLVFIIILLGVIFTPVL